MRIAATNANFPFTIKDVVHLLGMRIRRPVGDKGVYADCPICGDQRGKLFVNYERDVFHCNYCDAGDGMLGLYALAHGVSKTDAYHEIMKALAASEVKPASRTAGGETAPAIEQSTPASAKETHQTLTLLLEMLTLQPRHWKSLVKRGLIPEQIKMLGYKSTPSSGECVELTQRLLTMGCTVAGVPGFYCNAYGQWTVRFGRWTSGILVQARGLDGLVRGAQIRLDDPMEDGGKYLWLSSSTKHKGVTSGSPAHFIGNPFSQTVYVTEGILKADVAHYLMNRTFVAVAGANNLSQLEPMLASLAKSGTKLVVEAHDMDKFRNNNIEKGASRVYAMARQHGMECRRLTWNPNFKGIDDWQLHVKNTVSEADRVRRLSFKERYLNGHCEADAIRQDIERWHSMPDTGKELHEYLGLTAAEYAAFLRTGNIDRVLQGERAKQRFRLYQLELHADGEVIPFAFADISVMHKKGFAQPPAAKYRLVLDATLFCPAGLDSRQVLQRIKDRFGDDLPEDFPGRHVAPSDVIELYEDDERRYYYCNADGFERVNFSPMLTLPLKAGL